MKRMMLFAALLVMAVCLVVVKTRGQRRPDPNIGVRDRWEYLAVAGPSTTNFEPTDNPEMRKEHASFAREAFVLEKHLDDLGANGWELVSVAGTPGDPVYYFKRRK